MIVSHEHKFIYIKTYKTGSTSVETALSGITGPQDILTEASEQLRGQRAKPAQNYRLDHPAVPKRALLKRILGRPERHYHPSVGYYEHMPAWRVKTYLGDDIWSRYFKFSFERNPWDRQVSWYHYKTKSKSDAARPSFATFNAQRKHAFVENWQLYTLDGAIALDFIGRYERLATDFEHVLTTIGLKGQVSLPVTNVSRSGCSDYRTFYASAERDKIGAWYAPEIAHFGYEF
jgi:hypothetical protein